MRCFFSSSIGAVFVLLAVACGGTSDSGDVIPSPAPGVASPAPPNQSEPAPAPSTPPAPAKSECDEAIYVADATNWKRAGSNPKGYEMTADASRAYCEKAGAHVRSLSSSASADKFGTFVGSPGTELEFAL